jgi:hypothetical protein
LKSGRQTNRAVRAPYTSYRRCVQKTSYRCDHRPHRHGLLPKIIPHYLIAGPRRVSAGENHWNLCELLLQLQLTAELNALHSWHRLVRDDEVRPLLVGGDKPSVAIASSYYPIALKLEYVFPRVRERARIISSPPDHFVNFVRDIQLYTARKLPVCLCVTKHVA